MIDQLAKDAASGRGPDKLLAMGVYGETVAAYRYTVLAEKAPTESGRKIFADMADEEQGHKQQLQKLIDELYPDTDFFLTPEDKEEVVTGPRLIKVTNAESFADVMRMIIQTERKTARFYATHGRYMPQAGLKALFSELAEEGAEHYNRLKTLAREMGIADYGE